MCMCEWDSGVKGPLGLAEDRRGDGPLCHRCRRDRHPHDGPMELTALTFTVHRLGRSPRRRSGGRAAPGKRRGSQLVDESLTKRRSEGT